MDELSCPDRLIHHQQQRGQDGVVDNGMGEISIHCQRQYPITDSSEPSPSHSNSLQPHYTICSRSPSNRVTNNSVHVHAINTELLTFRQQPLLVDTGNANAPQTQHPIGEPIKLRKTLIGLTFQATLALMIFHFQGVSSTTSPNPPSILFDLIGVCMTIGFTSNLIGILLQNAWPTAARIGEYTGVFSAAFGFFMMIQMILSERVSWIVWPAGVFFFIAFVFALANHR